LAAGTAEEKLISVKMQHKASADRRIGCTRVNGLFAKIMTRGEVESGRC